MRFLADAIHPEDLRQVARDALRNDGEPAVLLRDAARHHRSRRHRGRLHRHRTREQVRKRVCWRHFYIKKRSFNQGRLGTNMGQALKNRVAFREQHAARAHCELCSAELDAAGVRDDLS